MWTWMQVRTDFLLLSLYHMFNLSPSTGYFPNSWKYSFLTPILKSGDKSIVSNYRSISIVNTILKVFEIYDHLSSTFRYIFIGDQFGFRSNSHLSLICCLIIVSWLKTLKEGCPVYFVYSDFSDTFNCVNQELFIYKLGHLGIGEPLLRWIKTYVTSQIQKSVFMEGFLRKFKAYKYNIHHSNCLLFADECY